jgi:hypothetical protein
VTHDGIPIVIRSREWNVLRAQDRLRKIRNSIQHLDGMILKGEEKIVFAFRPGERGLEFEGAQLSYAELVEWLVELNHLSKTISSAKEELTNRCMARTKPIDEDEPINSVAES